ncbi:hypothetical protein NX059_001601 [Plenodomus lindquistii]|nr:hypothetical protein NX059_001601 [Plenodomus lindquistii]
MSPRKRPTESRSRGNSPPEKRSCPPARMPDRDMRKPGSIPSPPASRRSSTTAPGPNIPTGPRSDQHRSINASERNDRPTRDVPVPGRDSRIPSPGSFGSGASTPVYHAAPTVPSMLPQAWESRPASHLTHVQQHEAATRTTSKPTMDSLRKLRARIKATASNAKAPSMSINTAAPNVVSVSIPSEDTFEKLKHEITELKKERLAMISRIDTLEQRSTDDHAGLRIKVEELFASCENFKRDKAKQEKDLQQVLSRQDTVETSTKDLPMLRTDVSSIQDWKKTVPTTVEVEKLLDNKSEQSKKLIEAASDRHNSLAGTVQGLQNFSNDMTAIQTWKKSMPTEPVTKDFVRQEIATKVKEAVQSSNDITEKELKKNEEELMKLSGKHSELRKRINQHVGPAEEAFECTKRHLVERIREVEVETKALRQGSTDADKSTREWKDKYPLQTAQVKDIQSEQSKLASRMDSLEKVALIPTMRSTPSCSSSDALVGSPSEPVGSTTSSPVQLGDKNKGPSKPSDASTNLTLVVTQIQGRLQQAEDQLRRLTSIETQVKSRESIASKLADLKKHMDKELANLRAESLHERVNDIDEAVAKIEVDMNNARLQISVLNEDVPRHFNEKFDPLKESVQQALDQISKNKMTQGENKEIQGKEIAAIQKSVTDLEARTQAAQSCATTAADVTAAQKQEVERLRQTLDEEKTISNRAVGELNGHLAAINGQMDALSLALRNLQDQYTNITTDDLHQKMVHWFLQHYPANNGQALHQIGVIRQDVARLQSQATQTAWIPSSLKGLQSRAAQTAWIPSSLKKLQPLLDTGNRSETSQEDLQKIENARKTADSASTTATSALSQVDVLKQQIESLEATCDEQRKVIQGLKDASSSCVNTPTVEDHNASLQEVRSQIKCIRETLNPHTKILETLEHAYMTFIKPNEAVFPFLAQIFITILQILGHLDDVNQNTAAREALQLDYTYDLRGLAKDL